MATVVRSIRILLLPEGKSSEGIAPCWVAQCLEYDIAAQGSSIKAALDNFRDVFLGQVSFDLERKRKPLADKKQAPPWYWQALEEAEPLKNVVNLNIPKRSWFTQKSQLVPAEAWVR